MNSQDMYSSRFQRHIDLPEFGSAGQEALKKARVLVAGAGGLGCPVMQYLAASGIGHLGIADWDHVEISNLHRQVLYAESDIGRKKVEAAGDRIRNMNANIDIKTYQLSLNPANVIDVLSTYDLVVDGTDNFATRYLLNDACVLLDKSYIYGAIFQYECQVSSFHVKMLDGTRSANYRHWFPQPPVPGSIPTCSENGVLSVVPGIAGMIQALEVIKLLTGLGEPLANKIWILDTLSMKTSLIGIPNTGLIPTLRSLEPIANYCFPGEVTEVSHLQLRKWTEERKMFQLVDVRELGELDPGFPGSLLVPLSRLRESIQELEKLAPYPIVFYCRTGRRSKEAASLFSENSQRKIEVYALSGGLAGRL